MNKVKAVLAATALITSGSVFAGDVLLVNTDSDSNLMTVNYKICDTDTVGKITSCQPEQSVVLKGKDSAKQGRVFARVTAPTDHQYVMITTVTSTFEHRADLTATFAPTKLDVRSCSGSQNGDVISFNTEETDTILCNNTNIAGSVNTHG